MSKTRQKKLADTYFSKIIRHPGVCVNCGATDRLQCAHIISRGYLSIRWDERNAVPLCSGCHVFFTHHPVEWENWVNNRFGADYHLQLKQEALLKKRTDYDILLVQLKAEYERLYGTNN